MIKVIDDLLDNSDFKKLSEIMLSKDFPWFFLEDKVHKSDGHFQMCHNFFYRVCHNQDLLKFWTHLSQNYI